MAPLFLSSHCDGQKLRCNWECGGGYFKGVVLQAAISHWIKLVNRGKNNCKKVTEILDHVRLLTGTLPVFLLNVQSSSVYLEAE